MSNQTCYLHRVCAMMLANKNSARPSIQPNTSCKDQPIRVCNCYLQESGVFRSVHTCTVTG